MITTFQSGLEGVRIQPRCLAMNSNLDTLLHVINWCYLEYVLHYLLSTESSGGKITIKLVYFRCLQESLQRSVSSLITWPIFTDLTYHRLVQTLCRFLRDNFVNNALIATQFHTLIENKVSYRLVLFIFLYPHWFVRYYMSKLKMCSFIATFSNSRRFSVCRNYECQRYFILVHKGASIGHIHRTQNL